MLRYRADIKSLIYMLVTTGLLVTQWVIGDLNPFLFVASLYMGVSVSVMAHNHNHLSMWKHKSLNTVTDYWITMFYGFPAFAWIPTHNQNHHKFNNRDGDYTITYRVSEANNLLTLLSYPTVSGYYQQKAIAKFLKETWAKNRPRFLYYISQYVVLLAFVIGAFFIDWRKALLFIFIPQQFALFSVLVFNYVQHIHADEEDEYNHSRNFVGWGLNKFLFNNGFHTVHHETPGLHWSKTDKGHAERFADKVHASLTETSFHWYLVRAYLLGIFVPRFRTQSMRLARLKRANEKSMAAGDLQGAAAGN